MMCFFIAVPLTFSVLFSATWLLTYEMFDGHGRGIIAKAFGRVAVASMLGGTLGAAAAAPVARLGGPKALLLVGAGLLACVVAVIVLAHKTFPAEPETGAQSARKRTSSVKEVLTGRYSRLLAAIAIAGAFAAIMIDFQFYVSAASVSDGSHDSASYFAKIYLLVNGGALLFQLLFGARLQQHLGVAGALMILPLVLFGGGFALVFGGAYMMRAGLRVTEGGLRSSIHRSNWEQAFIGIAQPARPIAKVVIDGVLARIAAGVAALVLYGWLTFTVADDEVSAHSTTWISLCIVGSTIVWLAATIVLQRSMQEYSANEPAFMPAPLPDS